MGREDGEGQKEGARVQETVLCVLCGVQVSSAVRQQVNRGSGMGRWGPFVGKGRRTRWGVPVLNTLRAFFISLALNITTLEGSVVVIFSLQMGEPDSISMW